MGHEFSLDFKLYIYVRRHDQIWVVVQQEKFDIVCRKNWLHNETEWLKWNKEDENRKNGIFYLHLRMFYSFLDNTFIDR